MQTRTAVAPGGPSEASTAHPPIPLWQVRRAAEPSDVVWENLECPAWARLLRRLLAALVSLVMILARRRRRPFRVSSSPCRDPFPSLDSSLSLAVIRKRPTPPPTPPPISESWSGPDSGPGSGFGSGLGSGSGCIFWFV